MDVHDLITTYEPFGPNNKHIAVFYLHGGGLLYGERDDLPSPYIELLTKAGYTVIAADYPLAPESALPDTMAAITSTFKEAVLEPTQAGTFGGYVLFGRSAGANLTLLLSRELKRQNVFPQPLGIIDLYGYYDLTDEAIALPAKAYRNLPEVSRKTVDAITRDDEKPTTGAKSSRYALYVYARQQPGAWLDLIGLDGSEPSRKPEYWSLSEQDIASLPPLFIAASSGDEDIPLRISKTLWRKAPQAKMKTVYYLPHDFDRDITKPEGIDTYREIVEWMGGLL